MCHRVCWNRLHHLAIFAVLVFPSAVSACLWDYDTLRQERSRFPIALELMIGKFARHSPEFYRWRLEDRKRQIAASGATPELLDDVAVAFDKLGEHAQAIATMQECEQKFPGRYETAANLGTFYFHAGQFDEGIPHIERAIQINPDAHFGREIYQLKLVKYLQSRNPDGQMRLPLAKISLESGSIQSGGFRDFILLDVAPGKQQEEVSRAIRGILGMMRFGKFDSPILLEVLGDLWDEPRTVESGNQHLAARAFLRASELTAVSHPDASAAYRKRAEHSLENQLGGTGKNGVMTIEDLEPELRKEVLSAQKWYAALVDDERNWIANSRDPEAEYDAKYAGVDQEFANAEKRSFYLQLVAWGLTAAMALYWAHRRSVRMALVK